MTGTDDLDGLRAAYREAVDGDATRVRTSEWIRTLQAEELEAMVQLDQRRAEADLEQQEADQWAGKGFRATLWAIFGRLDDRREKETTEALAAAARFAAARKRLDEIQAALATARASMPQGLDSQQARSDLLAALATIDPTGHQRYLELEEAAATAAAQLREHDEALAALDQALDDAAVATARLESARAIGAWDILGGGIISSAMKRERVRDAIEAIGRTGTALDRLRRELADIRTTVALPAGIEMGSGAWTFDVWWDNIFSDLNMQGRIRDTATQVERLAVALRGVRTTLSAARSNAAADATRTAEAAGAALRGA